MLLLSQRQAPATTLLKSFFYSDFYCFALLYHRGSGSHSTSASHIAGGGGWYNVSGHIPALGQGIGLDIRGAKSSGPAPPSAHKTAPRRTYEHVERVPAVWQARQRVCAEQVVRRGVRRDPAAVAHGDLLRGAAQDGEGPHAEPARHEGRVEGRGAGPEAVLAAPLEQRHVPDPRAGQPGVQEQGHVRDGGAQEHVQHREEDVQPHDAVGGQAEAAHEVVLEERRDRHQSRQVRHGVRLLPHVELPLPDAVGGGKRREGLLRAAGEGELAVGYLAPH